MSNKKTIEITEEYLKNSEKYSDIAILFSKKFVFAGKSLEEWAVDLLVVIPDEITPDNFRNTCALLAKKLQKANHFFTIANSVYEALSSGTDIKRSNIISDIVHTYESSNARRPGADLIKAKAEKQLSDTLVNKSSAKMVRDFWRNQRDTLIELRKTLEMVGFSMNMEIKYHDG